MPHGTAVFRQEAKEREEDIAQQAAQAREDERYDKTPAAAKVLGEHRYSGKRCHARSRTHLRRWRSSGHGLQRRTRAASPRASRAGSDRGSSGKASMRRSERRRRQVRATGHRPEGRQPLRSRRRRQRRGHRYRPRRWRAGGAAEQLATKGLARAGVQATSALGKAGVAAAKLGVRGAVEGGIIGGGEYAGEQLLQDHDAAADKLFSAIGTGSLYGAGVGAAPRRWSHLAGSGIKGIGGALSRARPSGSRLRERQRARRAALLAASSMTLDGGGHQE